MMYYRKSCFVFQSSYLCLLLMVVGLLWLKIPWMMTDELIWREQFSLFLHTISQFVFEPNYLRKKSKLRQSQNHQNLVNLLL